MIEYLRYIKMKNKMIDIQTLKYLANIRKKDGLGNSTPKNIDVQRKTVCNIYSENEITSNAIY